MNVLWRMALLFALAAASIEICPSWVMESKRVSDLGMLSETVSQDVGMEHLVGFCGKYNLVEQSEGIYDTRMRIYRQENTLLVVFRPTQQNPEAEAIHTDRKLVPCQIVRGCAGRVHQRFQEAFLDLLGKISPSSLWLLQGAEEIYLTGHSLGGSLQIFMGVYLWLSYGIIPNMMIGFAGPFIGDQEFSQAYPLDPQQWWQIETVDFSHPSIRDTTVEEYNTPQAPFLFINTDKICLLPISPQPNTYGMHDLINYRQGLYQ